MIQDNRLGERSAHDHGSGATVSAQERVFPACRRFVADDGPPDVLDTQLREGSIGGRQPGGGFDRQCEWHGE